MRQRLNNHTTDFEAASKRRTQSTRAALPAGATSVASLTLQTAAVYADGEPPIGKRIVRQLLLLGACLEALYLAFFFVLARRTTVIDPIRQAWLHAFPWLTNLRRLVELVRPQLARVPWLKSDSTIGYANLQLLLLSLAVLLVLLAVLVGRRIQREPFTTGQLTTIFWTIFLLTFAFSLTLLVSPAHLSPLSEQMLLSGLYGRIVAAYHVNPYASSPATLTQDNLQQLLMSVMGSVAPTPVLTFGPVWMDTSILVTLAARNSIASVLLGFRLIGVLAHLISVGLLWLILQRARPAFRISATVFYAWNPLVLVLGISQMHLEVVLVFFVLLAVLFFQRNALFLSWVFILLAVLVNLSALLLVPLFLYALAFRTRFMWWLWRICWWIGLLLISVVVVGLAYIPYWQGWGLHGLKASLVQFVQPASAMDSLDAAVLTLPFRLPDAVLWLFLPTHWMIFSLILIAAFLLLAVWLVDTVEWALVCAAVALILLLILLPTFWPWYVLFPLALALCSTNRSSIQLAFLLLLGSLVSYYFWQRHLLWPGQGLLAVGIPCLLWGWLWFLTSTWDRLRARQLEYTPLHESKPMKLVRPPWFSRPERDLF